MIYDVHLCLVNYNNNKYCLYGNIVELATRYQHLGIIPAVILVCTYGCSELVYIKHVCLEQMVKTFD